MLPQLLASGLSVGSIYALIALAMVVVGGLGSTLGSVLGGITVAYLNLRMEVHSRTIQLSVTSLRSLTRS